MLNKKAQRIRRAQRTRHIIREQGIARLTVNRTNNHIYAQIISPCGTKVLACASTLEADLKSDKRGVKVADAQKVGAAIAEKSQKAGIESVAFDRSGFRYHGKIKALADAAREKGLKF